VVLIGVFLFANELAASLRFLVELLLFVQEPSYGDVVDGVRDVFVNSYNLREGIVSIGSAIVGAILMFRGRAIASTLSKRLGLAEKTSTRR